MNTRRTFAAFFLIVVLCLCALIYTNPGTVTSIAAYAIYARSNSTKTILYWNKFFGSENFYLGEGFIARDCPKYNNCFATHSRFLQNVENFDAVVFHGINDDLDPTDLPDNRRPEQKYVFIALESPQNRFIHNYFDGFFNVTMTYHLDSDVVWTYADVVQKNNQSTLLVPPGHKRVIKKMDDNEDLGEEFKRLDRLIKGKRKLAVWYRSNCKAQSAREEYVDEFEKYAQIDKYGKCSKEQGCSRDKDCFKIDVEPNYFFYLSFENSFCDDYVTEKFYNSLKYYVVPVVYGGADYSKLAPPNSFINALDFDTPKDLAKYLKELSLNATEYKKYFEWKKEYVVVDPRQRVICDLCEVLNTGKQKKSYMISRWYNTNKCPLQHRLRKQILNGGPTYATKKTLYV